MIAHVQTVSYRSATPADAAAVAALHADSWRRHYRGAYADDFLDGDVTSDRLQLWTHRLNAPSDGTWATFVAAADEGLIGFAHTILDADDQWGALLDNLHVSAACQRRGIGAALLRMVARFVCEARPGSGLYLWVLEQNVNGQAFYRANDGSPADREPVKPVNGVPGRLNGSPEAIRYVWPTPASLLSG